MTREEAEKDGVTFLSDDPSERACLIPCEICGRKIRRTQYSRKRTYICDYCKGIIKEKTKPQIPNRETKYDVRFENAINNIKNAVNDFEVYKRAVEIAKTRTYSYGSIPEAMVAIELLKNKLKIIPQQKIGKYKVDFIIPDLKVALEVDGKLYHSDVSREGARDFYLQSRLGIDWIIIHFPVEYIEKDITKLVPYIRTRIKNEKE